MQFQRPCLRGLIESHNFFSFLGTACRSTFHTVARSMYQRHSGKTWTPRTPYLLIHAERHGPSPPAPSRFGLPIGQTSSLAFTHYVQTKCAKPEAICRKTLTKQKCIFASLTKIKALWGKPFGGSSLGETLWGKALVNGGAGDERKRARRIEERRGGGCEAAAARRRRRRRRRLFVFCVFFLL